MIGLFRKKTEREVLEKKYRRLLQEAYKLSGYVVNANNEPLANVLVSGGEAGTRVTNAQGYFEFLVYYGTKYTLSIELDEDHYSEDPVRQGTIYGPVTHVFKAALN